MKKIKVLLALAGCLLLGLAFEQAPFLLAPSRAEAQTIPIASLQGVLKEYTGTADASSVTKLITNPDKKRRGVIITNNDTANGLSIRVKLVRKGASAPTISEDTYTALIVAGEFLYLAAGPGIDIYAQNTAADATTSKWTALEVL
jgi:hypothetical protein